MAVTGKKEQTCSRRAKGSLRINCVGVRTVAPGPGPLQRHRPSHRRCWAVEPSLLPTVPRTGASDPPNLLGATGCCFLVLSLRLLALVGVCVRPLDSGGVRLLASGGEATGPQSPWSQAVTSQEGVGFPVTTPSGSGQPRFSSRLPYISIQGWLGALLLVTLALGPRLSKQPPSYTCLVPMAEGRRDFWGGSHRRLSAWPGSCTPTSLLLTTHWLTLVT